MTAALLPSTEEDFRSQQFWDGFFRARGAAAFEWYGEWRQLCPIVAPLCAGRRILVPGCGNSELSAHMCAPLLPLLLSRLAWSLLADVRVRLPTSQNRPVEMLWTSAVSAARTLCASQYSLGFWCRYDDGFRDVVNIDFSPVVIREMLGKNLRARPTMRWQVRGDGPCPQQRGQADGLSRWRQCRVDARRTCKTSRFMAV
jgi:hypothetical protein